MLLNKWVNEWMSKWGWTRTPSPPPPPQFLFSRCDFSLPVTFGLIIPSSLWFVPYFKIESKSWANKYAISVVFFLLKREGWEMKRERGETPKAMSSEFRDESNNSVTLLKKILWVVSVTRGNVPTTFQALWNWKGQQLLYAVKNKFFSSIQRGRFQLKATQSGWVMS